MARPEPFDRRTFLARGARTAAGLVVIGGAPGLLAACGGGGSSSSTSSSAGTSSAPPKPGGKVIFGLDSEFSGFDPTSGRWDASGVMRGRTVYDPLAAIAADGTSKPYLAQSITPNSDYTKWTFTMRPNIVFHNGTPLDANAVKVNFEALRASGLAGPAFANIASVDVDPTNPLIVVVSMKAPWVPFLASLNGQYQAGYIAEPSTLQNGSANTKPIGTGPFVFQEWIPNDHFTATKNPHYWRSGMPYLDSIEYRPIPDPQSRENSLKSGTVDIINSNDLQNYVDLVNNPSFSITDLKSQLEPNMTFFQINTAAPPVDDIRVRQALAYATDRQQFITVIDQGVPPESTGPFVSGSPYYAPTGYPNFNLSKAQSLVNQYKADHGGQAPSFAVGVTNTPKDLERGQLLQAQWNKAGFQVQISQTEQSQGILNALLGKGPPVYSWGQFAAADPDLNYVWWTSANASPVGALALNIARNKDPQIDQNLTVGRTSTDQAARATAYQNVAKRFAQDIPYLWLDREVWIYSAKPSVMNYAGGTLPDGTKAIPLIWGQIWPTQIWLNR